jgi:hypothetical protein
MSIKCYNGHKSHNNLFSLTDQRPKQTEDLLMPLVIIYSNQSQLKSITSTVLCNFFEGGLWLPSFYKQFGQIC